MRHELGCTCLHNMLLSFEFPFIDSSVKVTDETEVVMTETSAYSPRNLGA